MSAKRFCSGAKMTAAVVNQAREWANELLLRESAGPGDLPNTMQRLERRYGVSQRLLWTLRYRPPKDLLVSAYLQLRSAYLADCDRQRKRLEHEIEITKATVGDTAALEEAAALVSEARETLTREHNIGEADG